MTTPTHHGTAVALRRNGAWTGVLIRGPSGAGKSDLALRLMDQGARLVADDRVHLWASEGALYARAPSRIAGLIEVRGVGIVRVQPLDICRITLVIDLFEHPPERMPDPQSVTLCGISVAALEINPRPTSASAAVIRAMEAL